MRRDFQTVADMAEDRGRGEYAVMRSALNGSGLLARLWEAVKLALGRL